MDVDDLLLLYVSQKYQKKNRRCWVHETLQRREELGESHTLIRELSSFEDKFYSYFRMSQYQFQGILDIVKEDISKSQTNFRNPISARDRLAVCLRYLATGDSYKTVYLNYRLGKSTVATIIPEVCDTIWKKLQPLYMPIPSTDWRKIADGFQERWQSPNCIGSLDGKHVVIQAPSNSGSTFYNYKGGFSIVLMALVDHKYGFTIIDVGGHGSNSDGGIFAQSALGKAIKNYNLAIPQPRPLPGFSQPIHHVIVADEAFPLSQNIIRIYNYRLSGARRVVENSFGILASKWEVYQRRIKLQPQNVDKVIKATCVLHNYIIKTTDPTRHNQAPECMAESNTSGAIQNLQQCGNQTLREAFLIREAYKDYFMSTTGAVPWQQNVCFGVAQ
uniref:DDE Tnp4 domain-containing protein n=1 Tax=Sinocyclocheilus anshuiensis TaxID=1608454 RepID=A0A671KRG4_9TELE